MKDADEPPVFVLEEFFMEVAEDNLNGSFVGTVSARDPDDIDSPIRYTPNLKTCLDIDMTEHNIIIWFLVPLKITPQDRWCRPLGAVYLNLRHVVILLEWRL